MDSQTIVAILNELLAVEQSSVLARLNESTVFVSRLSAEASAKVKKMAAAQREHCAWLGESILTHGGTPGPRVQDMTSGDLHFQELHYVMPRLIADREAIIAKYKLAVDRLSAEPAVVGLISRILARHQDELTSLAGPIERPASTAG